MFKADSAQQNLHQELVDGSVQIKRYLNRHAHCATEAADFYQETIARVLEQANGQTIHNPVAYAIRIARNLIINSPKHHYADEHEPVCSSPSAEETLLHNRRVALLEQALKAMPTLRRTVFIRRRLHGDSRKDIARALGLSEEAVKKHATRAMADLQRYLDNNKEN